MGDRAKWSDDELLRKAAKIIKSDYEEDKEGYDEQAANVDIEPNKIILSMVRDCDNIMRKEKKIKRKKLFACSAAVFLLCVLMSHALVKTATEGPVKEWTNYWYPTNIPKQYEFVSAEEIDGIKILSYKNIENECVLKVSTHNGVFLTQREIKYEGTKPITFGKITGYALCDKERNIAEIVCKTDKGALILSATSSEELATLKNLLTKIKFAEE